MTTVVLLAIVFMQDRVRVDANLGLPGRPQLAALAVIPKRMGEYNSTMIVVKLIAKVSFE